MAELSATSNRFDDRRLRLQPDHPGAISRRTALWLGLAGVLGGVVLIAGDMLFYFEGASLDFVANMSRAAPERIIASAVCALVAAWLYVLGSGQIYFALQPAAAWLRRTVFLSFVAVMIAYGVVHGAYVAIATSAKNAAALGLPPGAAVDLAVQANDALRLTAYLPFGIFTIFFGFAVWTRRTYYPRWFLLFSPILPFAAQDLIVGGLEGE
ncbi:MAG: DUF6796 family protein, partial [Acidobacteriota bacterium]